MLTASPTALRELLITCQEMEHPPYHGPKLPDDRLARALALVQEGRVIPHTDVGGVYTVAGATETYRVTPGECDCVAATKGKRGYCYHRIAVKLYEQWQLRLGEPMPPATKVALTTDTQLPLGDSTTDHQDVVFHTEPEPYIIPPLNGTTPLPPPPRLPLPMGRTLRPLHAILADLRRPLPEACIPTLTIKGNKIRYVHWYQVTRLLDMYAPGWQVEVARYDEMKGATIVLRLTLHCAEGHVSRDGIGREDEDEVDYGNKATNAYAQAFKRAAAMFGVDWLYDREGIAAATDKFLRDEHEKRLKTLGEKCDEAGVEKTAYIEALKALAGVRQWSLIPVGMMQEAIAHVEAYAAQKG